ncbi:LOW QUALITY PROTEIN: uncharacterized protein LOC124278081 [Haliotis rubra]|uniref:LOW QUALITY PROTEIN: uncharacterized protein LOC124278081 n=1 Tax=Haliotis rubra TaxID=36100 RepID=UPI001EE55A28|nr:LOW QUALITY PROTEIN: uncharacterized protein LOC124278081 [Haliotis rubra]
MSGTSMTPGFSHIDIHLKYCYNDVEDQHDTFGIPLFMAADVLAGISQVNKNNCRIHNRFGKEGLATKLLFSDSRLNGTSNSGSVWFYNIQGVFRAVFEYHELFVQRDCLLKLRDVWLQHYSEPDLPESMSLSWTDSVHQTENSSAVKQEHLVSLPAPVLSSPVCDRAAGGSVASTTVDSFIQHIVEQRNAHPSNPELSVVAQVLEFLKLELCHYEISPSNCFPFEMFSYYRTSLGDAALQQELRNCAFNIPTRKNIALCVVAEWLGQEFHNLERNIAKRVDAFKKEHINCIDNLPPAESIVTSLFPTAMKRLLSRWIGLNQLHSADCMNQDHNYSPPDKRQPEQTRNLFPLIQIILEFANNALISGTAHVVFSRLRYAV